jgi:penicillin-binding protein-related factor A (putative recombinase)
MVFNMRDVNETYIIHIHRVLQHKNACKRKSFPLDWMREVGFKVHGFMKVSRFTYEVMPFFDATGKRLLAGFENPL